MEYILRNGGIDMEPFILDQKSLLLRLAAWENAYSGLVAGFTTRLGGNSKEPFFAMNCGLHVGDEEARVIQNRQQLSEQLGFPFHTWTCADQIHSNRIQVIHMNHAGRGRDSHGDAIQGTDGLITNELNVLLTSFYADCVPLLFTVPDSHIAGVAHAGWKGTAANIAWNMVETLKNDYQVNPKDIQVAIGPSIGACCYEVDDRVINGIMAHISSSNTKSFYTKQDNRKYNVDLKIANRILLEQAGVPSEQIISSQWCTSCRTDLFFSHRKEAGKTGRMAAFIGWRKEV